MPLIWNNKQYLLVSDDSDWDKLEYVVARKLFIQYEPTKSISIEFIKTSFQIYGEIEKIEIFRKNNNAQFAHVTFKDNRMAYFALIDIKQQTNSKIQHVRPADAHLQPDNSIGSTKSPLYNLPDKCLVNIVSNCDIHTLASLSCVCKKLCQFVKEQVIAVFTDRFTFEAITSDATAISTLTTISRLVRCIHPTAFELKIRRDLQTSVEWPSISIDFCALMENSIFVEAKFLKLLQHLDTISNRIKSIHLQYTIYDLMAIKTIESNPTINTVWPKVTMLIVGGYKSRMFTSNNLIPIMSLPNLDTLLIKNLFFEWNVNSLYSHAKHLQNIYFENCLFKSGITKSKLSAVSNVVRAKKTNQPLCLKFDHIRILNSNEQEINFSDSDSYVMTNNQVSENYYEIEEALLDEDIRKYIRVEIGGDLLF